MKHLLAAGFLFFAIHLLSAQIPFHRGVNLTTWFQTTRAHQVQFTKYTRKDLENIKSLGCDVIRLPINLFSMVGTQPGYKVDPLLFNFLDTVADWARDLNIYLILDNHSSDDLSSRNPDLTHILSTTWGQMARHFKDQSKYLMYEVMNEPNGISDAQWGAIQQIAIDSIRARDTTHTIVVGASDWNSYNDLDSLQVYSDPNLIYTFHFYDPFLFTHQGASWPTPPLTELAGVPFPYNAGSMPALPGDLAGTWVANSYITYNTDGTVARIHQLIDIAAAFKASRHVNVYCGEFGVFMANSRDTDRVYWYSEVRKYLEGKGIPWTTWDYQNGFGLFKKGSDEIFDYDLNTSLVNALGLNVPPQKVYTSRPDSVGFSIYSDYIGKNISESGNAGGGTIDFYATGHPNNGAYCLYWNGSAQYANVGFDFTPDKDMSVLVSENYALSFLVRGSTPGTSFDVRFTDTKTTDPNDHPWRMNYVINDNTVPWDHKWHKVYIPLKNFADMGSWDNNIWYDPEGKYDWSATDRFDIVAEHGSMEGEPLWFDDITVTNRDTAQIWDTTAWVAAAIPTHWEGFRIGMYPNPVSNRVYINYSLPITGEVEIEIYSINGEKIQTLTKETVPAGTYTTAWDLKDNYGNKVPGGIYLCRMVLNQTASTLKIVVMKN